MNGLGMCMVSRMPSTAATVTSSSALAASSSSSQTGGAGIATGVALSSSASTSRRNASQQSDETDSASDEVKVFNDEDEREPVPSNSDNRGLDFLTNIKSSLISETEQVSF